MREIKQEQVEVFYGNKTYYLDISNSERPVSKEIGLSKCVYKIFENHDDEINEPYFVIYVTNTCNMACTYCFNEIGKTKSEIFSKPQYMVEDFVSFVRRNYPNKEIFIRFFGGEPLLNKCWIYEFIETLEKEKIKAKYNIFTNITLLDEQFEKYIQKYSIDVYTSINGGLDKYKGEQFKNLIFENIRKLEKKGIRVITRMVWQPNCKESLVRLVEDAISNQIRIISITLPWGKEFSMELFKAQLCEFVEFYLKKLIEEHDYRYLGIEPFVGYISKWVLDSKYCDVCCSAGKDMISIATDGRCYPCHCFNDREEFCIGNIHESTERIFDDLCADDMVPCNACSVKYFCKAKCAADAFYATGNYHNVNLKKCEAEKAIIGASAHILYMLQENKKEYAAFICLLKHVGYKYNN